MSSQECISRLPIKTSHVPENCLSAVVPRGKCEKGWCLILAHVVRIGWEDAHKVAHRGALDTPREQSGVSSGPSEVIVSERPQTCTPQSSFLKSPSKRKPETPSPPREQDWMISR